MQDRINEIIEMYSDKNQSVVFDFDNTLITRDIGDDVFFQLIDEEKLTFDNIPENLILNFKVNDQWYGPNHSSDLKVYYQGLLKSTENFADQNPYGNAYAWAVQVMQGMTVNEIVEVTRQVANKSEYFYPKMLDIVGSFLDNNFDVRIITASNVWSVRLMIFEVLNKKLKDCGFKKFFAPQNVIGTSVLLRDLDGNLAKDQLLVRSNPLYKSLDQEEIKKYRLTSQLVLPVPTYEGKVANIIKWIGKIPILVVGDSTNDFAMFEYGKYKMWVNGDLEKITKDKENWIIQRLDESLSVEDTEQLH